MHAFRIHLQNIGQRNTRTGDAKRSFFLKVTERGGGGGRGGKYREERSKDGEDKLKCRLEL